MTEELPTQEEMFILEMQHILSCYTTAERLQALTFTPDMPLEALGELDSMDMVELTFDIENIFSLTFESPETVFTNFTTFGELCDYVKSEIAIQRMRNLT